MSVIEVKELSKTYKNGVEALKGISFNVEKGSIFAILGPNGAGKTTTLKSVLGAIKPTTGEVLTVGKNPFPNGVKEISFVPEEKSLYEWVRISEMVKIFGSFAPNFSLKKFGILSKRLNLTMKRKIGELSQGNRTKLYVALAFAQDVKLYLLDEPTWGLDPVIRKEVLDIVKENAVDGKTVVYSSHILSEVEEVCDQLIILKEGKILYNGSLDKLKESNKLDLSKAFLKMVKGEEK